MLESTVDLLDGLFFIAMILVTAVCIVGSIVAALHAISRGVATSESIQGTFVDDTQPVERPLGGQVLSVDDVFNPVGPKETQFGPGKPLHIYRENEKKNVQATHAEPPIHRLCLVWARSIPPSNKESSS